jgi:hypothetical protein
MSALADRRALTLLAIAGGPSELAWAIEQALHHRGGRYVTPWDTDAHLTLLALREDLERTLGHRWAR